MSDMETPRREGASPWKVALIGCLGLALVVMLAVGVIAYEVTRPFRAAVQYISQSAPPVNPKVVAQQFTGIPIYPGARLDLQATGNEAQWQQAMAKSWLFGGAVQKEGYAVYAVAAGPTAIIAWYDKSMASRGWSIAPRYCRTVSPGIRERTYEKANVMLTVFACVNGPGGKNDPSVVTLTLTPMPAGGAGTP